MAKGPRYNVPFRRRKEGKTNYKIRKALLLSGKPRLVVRNSLNNMTAQIIIAKPQGDQVTVSSNTKQLIKKFGWKLPTGNIPAAYLTGLLCGLKARAEGVDSAIMDIGLNSPTKGAAVFATLKGVLDAGVKVPHKEEKLPDKERIEGQHIAGYAEILTSSPEEYQAKFSKYLKTNLTPEDLTKHFTEVKKNIIEALSGGD
ncbi:MAG: 50S ribosomal protein L18 [Candidatus Bathyarchaeota archaeon]|jgi:large subunit ribosomal protein L18